MSLSFLVLGTDAFLAAFFDSVGLDSTFLDKSESGDASIGLDHCETEEFRISKQLAVHLLGHDPCFSLFSD
jgi:hypothetical protein